MLPNDPRLALLEANATMAERHRQAAQDRLVTPSRSSGRTGPLTNRRHPSAWLRGLTDLLRTAVSVHGHTHRSAADDKPGTAVS